MFETDPSSEGLFASLRRLADSGLKLLQNRLELFSVEMREEKCRAIELLILAVGTLFLCVMAVTVVTFTIVFLFWESARMPVLVVFSVLYTVGAGLAVRALRERLKDAPAPFSGTLSEIKKDREWLDTQN